MPVCGDRCETAGRFDFSFSARRAVEGGWGGGAYRRSGAIDADPRPMICWRRSGDLSAAVAAAAAAATAAVSAVSPLSTAAHFIRAARPGDL